MMPFAALLLVAASLAQTAAAPATPTPTDEPTTVAPKLLAPSVPAPAEPNASAVPEPAPAAPASEPPSSPPAKRHFDRPRDIYVSGATSAALGGEHNGGTVDTSNSFTFGVDVATGFFLGRHIALGSKLLFDTTVVSGVTQVDFALGPVITGRVALSDVAHVLPTVSLLYDIAHVGAKDVKETGNFFVVDIASPFAFELGQGLAVTVGPYVSPGFGSVSINGVVNSASKVSYGIRAGILGWL